MHCRTLVWVTAAVLTGCRGVQGPDSAEIGPDQAPTPARSSDEAAVAFADAATRAAKEDFAGAVEALSRSLRSGYRKPSHVLTSPAFRPLLDDPQWRPRVRELLDTHAREHSIAMVRDDEPGEPMVLTIRIVGGQHEPPQTREPPMVRAGVAVGVVHVDADGYYRPWAARQDWNPRLFGHVVTDATGTVVVHTVRPGHYAREYEAPNEPAHVHYNVRQGDVLLRASEFFFDDDPRLAGDARREAEAARVPIASVTRDASGVWRASVTIPVRGLR